MEKSFGKRIGEMNVEGKRRELKIGMKMERELVKKRFEIVGEEEKRIKKIEGKGINIGLRDEEEIEEVVVEKERIGIDIG